MAVARSFSDGAAISYVLPVLWMTSYFHTMRPMARIMHGAMFRRNSPGDGTRWTTDNYNVWSSSSDAAKGAKSAIND